MVAFNCKSLNFTTSRPFKIELSTFALCTFIAFTYIKFYEASSLSAYESLNLYWLEQIPTKPTLIEDIYAEHEHQSDVYKEGAGKQVNTYLFQSW